MTGRIIVACIIMLLACSNVIANDNSIPMNRRIELISLVMGTYYKYTHEEDVVVSNGRTVSTYTVTTLRVSWRRWSWEVVTTATIPMEYRIINRSKEMLNMILGDPRYYSASTLVIRRMR